MAADSIRHPPPRYVDLTGLPEPVVRQVERLVEEARRMQAGESAAGTGPPDGTTSLSLPPDRWRAELAAWKQDAERRADRYPPGHVVDDSRDTIHGDRDRV